MSDSELAALAMKGDATAFEEIYDRHSRDVARTLASFAGPDQDLLDDPAQDVFVRVIEGLPSYVPSRPFSHRLNTIALNVGRNHARGSSRVIPVDPLDLEGMAPVQEDGSHGSDEIIGKTLRRLVSRLPFQMQEVVSLRIGSGMS